MVRLDASSKSSRNERYNIPSMTFTGRILAYLDRQNRLFLWLAVVVSVLGLGIIDYETGPNFSISLFYIIPVALASWALGKSEGIIVTIICAALWDGLGFPTGQLLGNMPLYLIWNDLSRLGLLLI